MNNISEPIAVQVNGTPQLCPQGTTLPQLLIQLEMDPRLVAVEYNGEIVHRQFWDTTVMQTGDRLEVVTIVGGG
ncbi:thiamine biosynthesis protein ThiS [Leptolyngbya cf. ectocarpi LEGE 11479]|uniref:Thiamine biosynthesis protein ThiS n=1 Tax=Leptolyngbya cf. ectocarpi LEGE 11479 TaxID=1828722 RepID=A0A928ZV41_LEPEC|nr:sulfur carrier protein ThiS [Leptolyngbya ectocarpi]MBE9068042.1 thiamine biosynthesis protein ThiS [Leptolyngbya cf. ectocarpi LEGE 11479]